MCVEREIGIARDREGIDGKRVQKFRGFDLCWRRARSTNLRQTVGDVENEDNQCAVGRPFDLKVPEQRVGAEEIESLVNYVGLGWIGCRVTALARASTAQARSTIDIAHLWVLDREFWCE